MAYRHCRFVCLACCCCLGLLLTSTVRGDVCRHDLPSTSVVTAFKDSCYQFVSEERHWSGARRYCHEHGGHLVEIGDAETNDFVVATLNRLWWKNNGVWIGLHDRNGELQWQWDALDRHGYGKPVTWSNWASGHPEAIFHNLRDCVRMARESGLWQWHETPCNMFNWKYRFICQYEMTSVRDNDSRLHVLPGSSAVDAHNKDQPVHGPISAPLLVDDEDLAESSSVTSKSSQLSAGVIAAITISVFVFTSTLLVVVAAWRRKHHRKSVQLTGAESSSTQHHVVNVVSDVEEHQKNEEDGGYMEPAKENNTYSTIAETSLFGNLLNPFKKAVYNLYTDSLRGGTAASEASTSMEDRKTPNAGDYCPMSGASNRRVTIPADLPMTPTSPSLQPGHPGSPITPIMYESMNAYHDPDNVVIDGYDAINSGNIYAEIPADTNNIYEPISDGKV